MICARRHRQRTWVIHLFRDTSTVPNREHFFPAAQPEVAVRRFFRFDSLPDDVLVFDGMHAACGVHYPLHRRDCRRKTSAKSCTRVRSCTSMSVQVIAWRIILSWNAASLLSLSESSSSSCSATSGPVRRACAWVSLQALLTVVEQMV